MYETRLWRVVLAPNQCLPGRCVLHLKRHCGDLAGTSPEEMLDWWKVVKTMESAVRQAFGATLFNWGCYMNLSYREQTPDPHLHWWLVPRYKHPVRIGALVFHDPHFGSPYDHTVWRDVSKEVRQQIALGLQQAIP